MRSTAIWIARRAATKQPLEPSNYAYNRLVYQSDIRVIQESLTNHWQDIDRQPLSEQSATHVGRGLGYEIDVLEARLCNNGQCPLGCRCFAGRCLTAAAVLMKELLLGAKPAEVSMACSR